jgi:hypothetical protein
LAAHAAPRFQEAAGMLFRRRHRELAETVGRWWSVSTRGPRTLVHNDFTRGTSASGGRPGPGSSPMTGSATVGPLQRDLAGPLLVLPPTVGARTVQQWVERHRLQLERQAVCCCPPASGARCRCTCRLLINRLSFYAVIDRVSWPFSPRFSARDGSTRWLGAVDGRQTNREPVARVLRSGSESATTRRMA